MQDHAPPTFQTGQILDGRFEIQGVIGEGGWATIYCARQLHVDRLVALKLLSLVGSGEEKELFRTRFMREAQLAAQLKHPNIVTVHDVGFVGEAKQPYIVMEYLEGRDLEAVTVEGPMSLERALRLLCPCIEAIALGHRAGIIHRDLKPANLFIVAPGTDEERMVVLDFGIARLESRGNRITEEGAFFGTPAYLAPEWIQNQFASPAMDVYQLGLILIECLTGEPAVEADTPYQCLNKHVEGEINIPDDLRVGPLGEVIRRATTREYSDRYQHCGEFLDGLVSAIRDLELEIAANWKTTSSWESLPNIAALVETQRRASIHSAPSLVLQDPSLSFSVPNRGRKWRLAAMGAGLVAIAVLLTWMFIAPDTDSSAQTAHSVAAADAGEPETAPVADQKLTAPAPDQKLTTPQPALSVALPPRIPTHLLVKSIDRSANSAAAGASGANLEDRKKRRRAEKKQKRTGSEGEKRRKKKRSSMTVLP